MNGKATKGLSHLEFANTYGPIEWPGDCSECGRTASGCSWHIDGCCADCNHPEIQGGADAYPEGWR